MGILGAIEHQLWGSKLVFNFLFHGGHIALFAFGWWKQFNDPKLAGLNTLTFSVWISRGAGLALSVDGAMILLLMCRNILRWTIVHTCGHYVNFFNVKKTQIRKVTALEIHYAEAGGVTGHYTHYLFIPFLLGLYTHVTGCFVRDTTDPFSPFDYDNFWKHCIGYQGWRWELWGGGLYFMERVYRELRSRRETKITRVIRYPYNAVEIQFKKPSIKYKAGQWLFLNIPSVSSQQWHPFTITSCPYDDYISVHVRQNGIYEVALQNGQTMPALRIDGPYGAPAEDIFDNEIAVLIGTGIGVTPWATILKNIWHMRNGSNPPTRLRRVEFIWVCKDTTSVEYSDSTGRLGASSSGSEFLRIHIYLTQRIDIDTAQNIVLNSVGAAVDPLTELKSRTNFGRPDFPKLLTGMREGILDRTYLPGLEGNMTTNVGVYFCGPNVATRSIKEACKRATVPEVQFSFWKEHF
ncbi:FAD-binding domain-containing protein [Leptodontidium sp. MPI-SDFR-AT-0119]|nr:FAD-binding domain-containing protein [Leptodontidium sp. MPI-SDFR-AT-0119]